MTYNKRIFLNSEDSSSTGSIVCFDGDIRWSSKQVKAERTSFIEVADCQVKARLHRTVEDSAEVFIEKVKKMRNSLNDYIEHLECRL